MLDAAAGRERDRLQALYGQAVLDTPPEPAFDTLAYLAAEVCGAPIALVVFVDHDRLWFKARLGMEDREWPRNRGYCARAIASGETLLIGDAHAEPSSHVPDGAWPGSSPRFYAGAPIVTADGHAIGTVCVMDHVARELQPWQTEALRRLSRMALRELESRRAQRDQDRRRREAIGTLACGLAHEFNNLLTAVLAHAHLLESRLAVGDPGRTGAHRILENGRRSADLMRQLLAATGHKSASPQLVDLNALVSRQEADWRSVCGDDVVLDLTLAPGLTTVRADPLQIGQALRTLVAEVRGTVAPGGHLKVETTPAVEALAGGDPSHGGFASVTISEALPGAGSPGSVPGAGLTLGPTAEAGSDLDLSAAHGIVAQNGGHLRSLSVGGRPAGWRLWLPLAADED